jgi:hypothetical protein
MAVAEREIGSEKKDIAIRKGRRRAPILKAKTCGIIALLSIFRPLRSPIEFANKTAGIAASGDVAGTRDASPRRPLFAGHGGSNGFREAELRDRQPHQS